MVFRTESKRYPENSEWTATITAGDKEPPKPVLFQVSDLRSMEIDAPGDDPDVSATITNTGDQEATQDVRLVLAGSTQSTKSVTLDGGEETTVTFSADTSGLEPGVSMAYRIVTDDESQTGSITGAATGTGTTGEGGLVFGIETALADSALQATFSNDDLPTETTLTDPERRDQ